MSLHSSKYLFLDSDKNALTEGFVKHYEELMARHFSRNPNLYPIFSEPTMKALSEFQMTSETVLPSIQKLNPDLTEFSEAMTKESRVPEKAAADTAELKNRMLVMAGLSHNWTNRLAVENVGTFPSDPALFGCMIGSIANSNMVHHEYCLMTASMEEVVTRMIANMVGYDEENCIGLFTQGGTMCNMYGYLAGIRKTFKDSRDKGIPTDVPYRFIISQAGHYSNLTVLSTLGIGQEHSKRLKLNYNNQIDIEDFRTELDYCIKNGIKVPTILITMGTTDTFAVDDVQQVAEIRNQVCDKYKIPVTERPHIHADTAVGWALLFFLDYDFEKNPLDINETTIGSTGLKELVIKFKYLKYADSFTVDFHKWGYVPYTSSFVIFREKKDYFSMANDPSLYTYFDRDDAASNKHEATFECSRGAVGLYGAYASLTTLGKEGMQILIAHSLQNANYMRELLYKNKHSYVWAGSNNGPSVGLRLYRGNAAERQMFEKTCCTDNKELNKHILEEIKLDLDFHRYVYNSIGPGYLHGSWVESLCHSNYNKESEWFVYPGEKMVFFNPRTTRDEIARYADRVNDLMANYLNLPRPSLTLSMQEIPQTPPYDDA